jgi:adenosine deaminase
MKALHVSTVLAWIALPVVAFAGGGGEGPFSERFASIRREASPQELYAVLYDLPKGGDLHDHLGGAGFSELWWRLANDPTLTGGEKFYTRVRVNECTPECATPLLYYRTVRAAVQKAYSPCCRNEYEPLSELSEDQKNQWMSSLRIDDASEGRDEFFENIWPRIAEVLDQAGVVAEAAVENMKLFGAEGVRYVEFQMSPFGRRIGDRELSPDELHEVLVERLSRPDARATGVTVRFQTNVVRFAPDAEKAVEESYTFVDRHRDL